MYIYIYSQRKIKKDFKSGIEIRNKKEKRAIFNESESRIIRMYVTNEPKGISILP